MTPIEGISMTEQPFDTGTVFFRPGDPAEKAFLIHTGLVEILAGAARIAVLGPGDVFGEMSLIEERPHGMTARAAAAGRASALTRDEFEHLLQSDPAKARQYLRSLFERLRALAARVVPGSEEHPPVAAEVSASRPGPVAMPAAPGAVPPTHRVVVFPLTRRAAATLPDEGLLLSEFPFRIGRAPGPNDPEGMDLNDLWLMDQKPLNVSRNHCQIEIDKGNVVVRDRGSHLGCIVNDHKIGGSHRDRAASLHPGQNVLVLGGAMSAFQFRVEVGE
ncbi:MAG: cyclic nucleotide-binding domain-containing protein [Fimbriiglobus sp.]